MMLRRMEYRIRRSSLDPEVTHDWNAPAWQNTATLDVANHMGERPAHFPRTQARLLYSADAIHIQFRVEDRYVRAIAQQHQGMVWRDSCVEFFFSPTPETDRGYFNLEMNCGGTMLLHYRGATPESRRPIANEDLEQIRIRTSLPRIIDPQIDEPVAWTLACRLPLLLIRQYCPEATMPGPGVRWRANFYKCAEHVSHPHWITWAPVDFPKPNFHLPQFFGHLIFE